MCKKTVLYVVKKPDERHLFYEAFMRTYRDYLELKKIKCKCGKPLRIMETRNSDGSDLWAVCPDEPGKRYIIEPNFHKFPDTWHRGAEEIAVTSQSRVLRVEWRW